jgi:type VI secretion system protein ImpE
MNPPGRPLDVLYRPANIVLKDGPSGDVLLPGLYPGSYDAPDEELKLGRATDWFDSGKISRGFGAKSFMVGDDVKTFDKWRELIMPTA